MVRIPNILSRNGMLPVLLLSLIAGLSLSSAAAYGQGKEEESVRDSIEVLQEIMSIADERIPQRMLAGAEGIAIIPKVIKGGFVIGARRGHGTLLVREADGGWHAPVFVTLTGGSIGWQVGVQSTDVVLVFKTKKSIQGILSKKFTLGVDAAIAAGPLGRQAAAATDTHLNAEIYSYARSRGLFLGASFDGSMMQVDGMANAAYYRNEVAGQPAAIPPSAMQLIQLVDHYARKQVSQTSVRVEAIPVEPSTTGPVFAPPQGPLLAQQYSTNESDVIREQLSKTSPELFERIDPAWRTYLALPAEVFANQGHPTTEAVEQCFQNYDRIQKDPQYQALTTLPAFQSTFGLLSHYRSTLNQPEGDLILPPPPGVR